MKIIVSSNLTAASLFSLLLFNFTITLLLFAMIKCASRNIGIISLDISDESGEVLETFEIDQPQVVKFDRNDVSKAKDIIIRNAPLGLDMLITTVRDTKIHIRSMVEITPDLYPSGVRVFDNKRRGLLCVTEQNSFQEYEIKDYDGIGKWKKFEFQILPFFISHGDAL